uniref:Uncharacterized protein n=1 Tax=Trichogramma kaykai TaxID=54128 RepID=A0ABD2WWK5_9HYME
MPIRRLSSVDINSFFIRRSDATCTIVFIRRESGREMCTRTHQEASVRKRKSFASYKETQHTGRTLSCKTGGPTHHAMMDNVDTLHKHRSISICLVVQSFAPKTHKG